MVRLGVLLWKMFQELVLPSSTYKLVTPSGAPPLKEMILKELGKEDSKSNVLEKTAEDAETHAKVWGSRELYADADRLDVINLIKTLVLADIANAYSSVLPGNPNVSERQTRIALSAVRDLAETVVLSIIDKNFNLADVGAKSDRSNLDILDMLLKTGRFTIGFLGREDIRKRAQQLMSRGGEGSV